MSANDTPLNILVSFAFLYKDRKFQDLLFSAHREGWCNVMIDSGAFTAKNAKTGDNSHINVETYTDWLLSGPAEWCEKYVSLDVLGDAKATHRNYEYMVARGLKPAFVLTTDDEDWGYLRDTMSVNRHCCVPGGTLTRGHWMRQRYLKAYRMTGGQALIHALGYVQSPQMYQLPLVSVDSSGWAKGCARYATLPVFNKTGMVSLGSQDKGKGGKDELRPEFKRALDRWGVEPDVLYKKETWGGSASLPIYVGMMEYQEYQRYAYRQGLRLFMAIPTIGYVQKYLWGFKNRTGATYERFREEFSKKR